MFQIGETIDGTFQIIKQIGKGGTGVVYLAYHIRLQKYVVIKQIKGQFVNMVNVRAEVDILKSLKHTYLPQVYDFVQRGQQVYTVMDYIEGYDLATYIQNGYQIEEEIVVKWLRQLCEVLLYLHSQNPPIIHSDIKPENIMITVDGNVCLIDFNISLGGNDASQIVGISLPYASPEQYEKARLFGNHQEHRHIILDGRSDMYSLAASFYALVSGKKPENPYTESQRLNSMSLPYSGRLTMILDKAMSRDISQRYDSMQQMLKEVGAIYKNSRTYKIYLLSFLGSTFLYTILLILGIFLITYGSEVKLNERYEKNSQEFRTYYKNGDYEQAIDQGYSILNNTSYKSLLNKNKTDRMTVFYIIGDCYFELGDYQEAAGFYARSIKNVTDIRKYSDYYRDYIVALVRCGYIEEAQAQLQIFMQNDINSTDISLVNVELLVYDNKYAEAIDKIDQLLNMDIDKKMKVRILLLAGDTAERLGNYTKQIFYMEQALQTEVSVGTLRKLGTAYMNEVSTLKITDVNRKKYLTEALDCYKKLAEKDYTSFNDSINLAICYRALEQYKNSIAVLKEMEQKYKDYRIYMHLAFAYDKAGDEENAGKYTNMCLQLYEKTPEGDRESEGSDNMQSLKALKNKY